MGECWRCECHPEGSSTYQCDRDMGNCVCRGPGCDECARGFTGYFPDCQPCGECFQNWDKILQGDRNS